MREKIEITNFAGIKHWKVELKAINIWIGPQASGKSITAKLFYFFKSVFDTISSSYPKISYESVLTEKFCTYFPVSTWGKEGFYIKYTLDAFILEIRRSKGSEHLSITFSEEYITVFKLYEELVQNILQKASHWMRWDLNTALLLELKERYGNLIGASQLFIPAGRSFFSNIQSNIFTFLKTDQGFDPFLLDFGSLYETIKKMTSLGNNTWKKDKYNKKLDKLLGDVLHGKHVMKDGEEYLVHDKGKRNVHVNFASSGQQEALPLALFLRLALDRRLHATETVTYIEEPEAHLFPQSQKSVVEALATIANASSTPYQFIITTHSPYILAAFNNLIEAGNVLHENPDKRNKLFAIIDEDIVLKYDDVNAYSLKDGHCEKIMDDEMRLISPTILDEVSNDISVQFGELLDL